MHSSISSSLVITPGSLVCLNLVGIRRGDGLPDITLIGKNEVSPGALLNAFVKESSGDSKPNTSSSAFTGVDGGTGSSGCDSFDRDFPAGEPILGPKNNVAELATLSKPMRVRSGNLAVNIDEPVSLVNIVDPDLR